MTNKLAPVPEALTQLLNAAKPSIPNNPGANPRPGKILPGMLDDPLGSQIPSAILAPYPPKFSGSTPGQVSHGYSVRDSIWRIDGLQHIVGSAGQALDINNRPYEYAAISAVQEDESVVYSNDQPSSGSAAMVMNQWLESPGYVQPHNLGHGRFDIREQNSSEVVDPFQAYMDVYLADLVPGIPRLNIDFTDECAPQIQESVFDEENYSFKPAGPSQRTG